MQLEYVGKDVGLHGQKGAIPDQLELDRQFLVTSGRDVSSHL